MSDLISIKKEVEALFPEGLLKGSEIKPGSKEYFCLLNFINDLKTPDKIIETLETLSKKALVLDPGSEYFVSLLSYIYKKNKDYLNEKELLFRLLRLNPKSFNNWLNLSINYKNSGDTYTHNFILNHYPELRNRLFRLLKNNDKPDINELIKDIKSSYKPLDRLLKSSNYTLGNDYIKITTPVGPVKKKILFINPPIEEPFIMVRNNPRFLEQTLNLNKDEIFYSKDIVFISKGFVANLPIGLLRIAQHLLNNGNEIYFLDCLASLPQYFNNSKFRNTRSNTPYISISEDYSMNIFHRGLRYEEIKNILLYLDIDEIYIGCTFTYLNEPAHKVIEICKEVFPNVKIKFGGIYPTLCPAEAKKSKADEIHIGEFPGITDESLNYNILGYIPEYILIKGTKGCPNNCSYCAVHRLEGNIFNYRDPEDVFNEILSKYNNYGLRKLIIWDSNLLVKYDKYLGIILRKIIDNNLNLDISAPEGLDYRLITESIAKDLKNAGLKEVPIALENSDIDYSKNDLNRNNDLLKFKNCIDILKRCGFNGYNITVFLIIGLPGQTYQDVIKQIKFVWSFGCNARLFPFTPIPGTRLYEDNLDFLKNYKLSELHPYFFSCTSNKNEVINFIELLFINQFSGIKKLQSENYNQFFFSKNILDKFRTFD